MPSKRSLPSLEKLISSSENPYEIINGTVFFSDYFDEDVSSLDFGDVDSFHFGWHFSHSLDDLLIRYSEVNIHVHFRYPHLPSLKRSSRINYLFISYGDDSDVYHRSVLVSSPKSVDLPETITKTVSSSTPNTDLPVSGTFDFILGSRPLGPPCSGD